ncbi:MAG: hypothetical protein HYU28_02820 [Actinobacteria bacterium]|nr:hypothetical protein [Actinomycetota bacterium]
MKIKSRGLGRKELVMDFRRYEISREGDDVVVSGTITEPVNWDFAIRMSPQDIPGMVRVAVSPRTFGLGARWVAHVFRSLFRWLTRSDRRQERPIEQAGQEPRTASTKAAARIPQPATPAASMPFRDSAVTPAEVPEGSATPGSPPARQVPEVVPAGVAAETPRLRLVHGAASPPTRTAAARARARPEGPPAEGEEPRTAAGAASATGRRGAHH